MMLRRINPVPFGDLRREIDRLFEDFNFPFASAQASGSGTFPAVNLWEDQDHLFVEAEVPGMSMSDLDVTVIGNELSIRGQRKDAERGQATFHRRERGTGSFARFVTLPVAVESAKVEAVLRDGVLTITLPKAAEAKPRRIEVKAS